MGQAEKLSLEQIRAFLEASEEVHFEGEKREEIYCWISRVLQVQGYQGQNRSNRGLLRRYVEKLTPRAARERLWLLEVVSVMTGLSRAQVPQLIGRYLESGEVAK